ncbi:MAG TPA: carbohydrate ABC transporter permease [Candidatus Limnocylindrales bacterium]|nr:carbohydrate ABC transporter permease [Candidatus Limnocylindrales bacterium]
MDTTPGRLQDLAAGAQATRASRLGIRRLRPHRPRRPRDAAMSFTLTFIIVVVLAAFLSPILRSVLVSLKTPAQLSETNSPFLPSLPQTFTFEGRDLDVYVVPVDGTDRTLALLKPGRQQSQFVDPANPAAPPITWDGSWRTLERAWTLAPAWQNYADVWDLIDFPILLRNTIAIALIGMAGTIISCTLVAYGFARFRFPGRTLLFTILIATIFLPTAVTIVPTYTMFAKLGWVGTWLPLLIPTFFANAYDVFLLRQYMLTIPREMDEAAAIDGAGPFRTLTSVILPQAWPVIVAVAIFHLVYSWNDFFGPLIYLSTKPELQPLAVGLQRFNGIHYRNPAYVQAGTLMTMVIPVILFLIFQRVFIRGVVITGVEK